MWLLFGVHVVASGTKQIGRENQFQPDEIENVFPIGFNPLKPRAAFSRRGGGTWPTVVGGSGRMRTEAELAQAPSARVQSGRRRMANGSKKFCCDLILFGV